MSIGRRVFRWVGVLAWVMLTLWYWSGEWEPEWWFVGMAFTLIALDRIVSALDDELEDK